MHVRTAGGIVIG